MLGWNQISGSRKQNCLWFARSCGTFLGTKSGCQWQQIQEARPFWIPLLRCHEDTNLSPFLSIFSGPRNFFGWHVSYITFVHIYIVLPFLQRLFNSIVQTLVKNLHLASYRITNNKKQLTHKFKMYVTATPLVKHSTRFNPLRNLRSKTLKTFNIVYISLGLTLPFALPAHVSQQLYTDNLIKSKNIKGKLEGRNIYGKHFWLFFKIIYFTFNFISKRKVHPLTFIFSSIYIQSIIIKFRFPTSFNYITQQ